MVWVYRRQGPEQKNRPLLIVQIMPQMAPWDLHIEAHAKEQEIKSLTVEVGEAG